MHAIGYWITAAIAIVDALIFFGAWAMCKVAADSDKRMGYKE